MFPLLYEINVPMTINTCSHCKLIENNNLYFQESQPSFENYREDGIWSFPCMSEHKPRNMTDLDLVR